MSLRYVSAIGALALAAGSVFGQASFGGSGYAENFDSMGTAGTAAPTGWRHFVTSFGSNSTWVNSIPASGPNSVATDPVTRPATVLTASNAPTTTNNNGFNAAASPATPSDRVLAGSPTTVAGAMLQLQLQNNSGGVLHAGLDLGISFDTVRFTSVGTANQLPGFWLFISEDAGATWSNVLANPTILTVPNTVGVTPTSLSYTLAADWSTGSSIYFRFVDDNAQQTSPDQIVGLNNVSIVPAPGAAALLGLGVLAAGRRRR